MPRTLLRNATGNCKLLHQADPVLGLGLRTTSATPQAVSAMPITMLHVKTSSNSSHASTAVHGGTMYIRLVTCVAAPRWISRYSSELPPSVNASTDQVIAPISCGCHTTGSASSSASGNVTTSAANSCTALAVRTSQG